MRIVDRVLCRNCPIVPAGSARVVLGNRTDSVSSGGDIEIAGDFAIHSCIGNGRQLEMIRDIKGGPAPGNWRDVQTNVDRMMRSVKLVKRKLQKITRFRMKTEVQVRRHRTEPAIERRG